MSESMKNPLSAYLEGSEDTASASDFFADMTFPEPEIASTPAANPQPTVAAPVAPTAPAQAPATPTAPAQPSDVPSLFEQALAQTPAAKTTAPTVPAPTAPPEVPKTAGNAPVQTTFPGSEPAPSSFEEAFARAKAQSDERMVEGLAAKPAVFSYSKAKDTITDRDCTFEDLRAKYEGDFPELSEAKKVTWSVTYGKVTKNITNPGSDKVYDIKAEIEKSKAFLDGIKKGKTDAEKNPECVVKPRIAPQTKGEMLVLPDYKGYCKTEEEAMRSNKSIIVLPSQDGRLYQMRKTPVGIFTAPADRLPEFPRVHSGFQMTMPKIPMNVLMSVVNFFEALSQKHELEALVHILYNTETGEYEVRVPKQEITHISVNAVTEEEYPEHLIHVMDIHSHNTMPAKFSPIDDDDEKATRLYAVVGRLEQVFPDIAVRASCGGQFIKLSPEEVFETNFKSYGYPEQWHEQITVKEFSEKPEKWDTLAYAKELGERPLRPRSRMWRMRDKR